jgi:cell fate (sporulation/competence/biofilm development) regulator YlbF (YheA/YmcA/DUF963 family)
MSDPNWNELETAPRSTVMQAAKQFAEALAGTSEFQNFEQSYIEFKVDSSAQNALQEFQQKQASLKALLMLNALSEDDREELQRLQTAFYQHPAVIAHVEAQEVLIGICQNVGDLISKEIGMDYGNSCRTGGCCG